MRILLTSNASYSPPRGGSTRSNLAWLRGLAERGHSCRVICAATGEDSECNRDGVEIHSVKNLVQRRSLLSAAISDFQPDFVLVSSEDLSHMLLREAAATAADRLVYLAHTPQFFPFGGESWNADARAAGIVRGARAIVAISRTMADYIGQSIEVRPVLIHPPIYGSPPFAQFDNFGRGAVLMINPCAVKGIDIFLELACRYPAFPFAALRGWGTTSADSEALARLANVRFVESVDQIEDLLSETRVLLTPSLWYEGFGLIAMEAMLRGIPVISSDAGGLREALDGSGFVIPVRRIEKYLREFDEVHMPKPVIPEQNMEPWTLALDSLLHDQAVYEPESERCRAAALRFVSSLDASAFEKLLLSLAAKI